MEMITPSPPCPPTSKRSLPTRGWSVDKPNFFACGALKGEHHLPKDPSDQGGGRWTSPVGGRGGGVRDPMFVQTTPKTKPCFIRIHSPVSSLPLQNAKFVIYMFFVLLIKIQWCTSRQVVWFHHKPKNTKKRQKHASWLNFFFFLELIFVSCKRGSM